MIPIKDQHQLSWSEDNQPFSTVFGDHFYSRDDGQAETAHVFIDGNNLTERWNEVEVFSIGELGFGTGLNFLETWRQWKTRRKSAQTLNFISLEAYPLQVAEISRALMAWPALGKLTGILLENWQACRAQPISMDANTNLFVVEASVGEALKMFPEKIDAWYLDGFAPALNPDMWSANVMSEIAKRTNAAGTFSTYTSAGWVRRNLQEAGFTVEKKPGFGRKRDMTVGHLEVLT